MKTIQWEKEKQAFSPVLRIINNWIKKRIQENKSLFFVDKLIRNKIQILGYFILFKNRKYIQKYKNEIKTQEDVIQLLDFLHENTENLSSEILIEIYRTCHLVKKDLMYDVQHQMLPWVSFIQDDKNLSYVYSYIYKIDKQQIHWMTEWILENGITEKQEKRIIKIIKHQLKETNSIYVLTGILDGCYYSLLKENTTSLHIRTILNILKKSLSFEYKNYIENKIFYHNSSINISEFLKAVFNIDKKSCQIILDFLHEDYSVYWLCQFMIDNDKGELIEYILELYKDEIKENELQNLIKYQDKIMSQNLSYLWERQKLNKELQNKEFQIELKEKSIKKI